MLIIIIIPRGGSDHFVSRSEKTLLTFCELLFALTVMPLSKVCPQCEAVSPMRLKVCKILCEKHMTSIQSSIAIH